MLIHLPTGNDNPLLHTVFVLQQEELSVAVCALPNIRLEGHKGIQGLKVQLLPVGFPVGEYRVALVVV
jgi:hypothetical protein